MNKFRLCGLMLFLCSSCSEKIPESSFTKSSYGVEINQNLDKTYLPIKSYRIKNVEKNRKLIVSGLACDTYALNKIKGGSLNVYKLVGRNCTQNDEEQQLDLAEELSTSVNEKFILINTIY